MLTAEIRRFILTSIPSVPYLEALLLLYSEPAAAWSAASLAKRLYIGDKKAEELLSQLKDAGIVATRGDPNFFVYAELPHLHELIGELSLLYSKNLLEITHLIHSKTNRQAQQFADAFKLRRDT